MKHLYSIKFTSGAQRPSPQLRPEKGMPAELQRQRRALMAKLIKKQQAEELLRRRLAFSNQEETVFVHLEDLVRIEAKGNCCCIYAIGLPSGICVTINLRKLISQYGLDQVPFLFQTHRSHLVSLRHVVKLDKREGDMLILKGGGGRSFSVPITQRCKAELLERLMLG